MTLTLAIAVSLGANIILPLLLGGSDLANALTSIFATVFIVSVAFSVLRYSFLDVRVLVVRSVGYISGLALVLLLVALAQTLIFNISGASAQTLTIEQRAILVGLFALAALAFDPLRRLFNHLTTRLFFKGGYDSAKFISEFNANLVKHINIRSLLSDSAQDIESTLKATFCVIGVGVTQSTPQYLVGSQRLTEKQGKSLMEVASNAPEQIIVKQYASSKTGSGELLKGLFPNADVEVLVKLTDNINGAIATLGYIVLGPKKNGEVYNKTDLDVLRIVANELELAVQNSLRFEEIQRFNVTLQEEVDNATAKLRRTNKRLEELDSIKDDFISMASHQLRTPLTSVKGYLSMVLEGDAGSLNDTQAQMLKQAFTSSQRMVFLITDLLNVSRLKTGKFIIEPIPVNLSDVVAQELDQLKETAALKNIELQYDKPARFPQLMLDEVKIRQVVMNFVDNAIYYTPQGGHIRVELNEKPSTIELRVIDDGIGVPKSEQHHLFTKFYRATNARKARPDGTGLGLFMAQKVITAQGGTIIFNSQEGKGSTFGFAFTKSHLAVPGASKAAPTVAAAPKPEPKAASSK